MYDYFWKGTLPVQVYKKHQEMFSAVNFIHESDCGNPVKNCEL